jgi:hypothetical protein
MSRAAWLYQLQKLDEEEAASRRRLAEIGAALGETAALRQARETARSAAEEVRSSTVRQRDLELEMQGIKDDITVSNQRLYGGSIQNPKELGELEAKVASLGKLLEKREESLLEVMIGREEAEAAHERAQARLRELEASWTAGQSNLVAEQGRLEARLAEVTSAREALLPRISEQDLDVYQFLCQELGGQAVAVMSAETCATCGVELQPGLLERGREKGLLFCGNCERILVPEEDIDEAQK